MTAAAHPKSSDPFSIPPFAELLFNLAGLAAVAALAHYLFWVFAIAILPAMLGSVLLMGVEMIIIGKDEANVRNMHSVHNTTPPTQEPSSDGSPAAD